jgi:hypothetical protein
MPKLRVHAFGMSLDGYGTGPHQDRDKPLGVSGVHCRATIKAIRGPDCRAICAARMGFSRPVPSGRRSEKIAARPASTTRSPAAVALLDQVTAAGSPILTAGQSGFRVYSRLILPGPLPPPIVGTVPFAPMLYPNSLKNREKFLAFLGLADSD